MQIKKNGLWVFILICCIVFYIFMKQPQTSYGFVNKNIYKYDEFIKGFIEKEKGCINIDGIIDNNVNFKIKEEDNISFRRECDERIWDQELRKLYKELDIGEISTFENHLELHIMKRGGGQSNVYLIYVINPIEFFKKPKRGWITQINDNRYWVRQGL